MQFVTPHPDKHTQNLKCICDKLWKETGPYNELVNCLNLATLAALANQEDTPTFKESMASPDATRLIEVMEMKLATLQQ